jgi:hypothetical protein
MGASRDTLLSSDVFFNSEAHLMNQLPYYGHLYDVFIEARTEYFIFYFICVFNILMDISFCPIIRVMGILMVF